MTENEFLLLISEILETDLSELSLSSSLENLGWDSLSTLTLISEVDEHSSLKIEMEMLGTSKTLADIFGSIKAI